MTQNIMNNLWLKISGLAIIGFAIIIYIIPVIFHENTVKEAALAAKNTAHQYSTLRSYYTKNVVSKLANEAQVFASTDYKNKINSIPLPATMIHELSELSQSNSLKMRLYSPYPFPERASRKLDAFQKKAWKQLQAQPNKAFVSTENINGQQVVRVAISDTLAEQACVDCHNSHPLTPKVGWKLGDLRGVLEVIVPIDSQIARQKIGSYQLSFAMIIIFGIIFFILYRLLNTESKKKVNDVLVPLTNQKFALNAHSLVSMADIDGTITYVNDKFVEISGYESAELIGRKHSVLNSNNQPKVYWKNMHDTVLAGKVWHDEVRNRAKAGHYYWVDTTIVPNLNSNNEVIGFTSIRTDVTEQRDTMTSLLIAKEQAEVASVSKADFLANMSHEIRTPMNGVIGMTNLLLESELTPEQRKLAKTVKSSGAGLLTIINDILDFSKVEAGKLDLELIPFNLGRMVEDIGITMSYQSQMKGLQLICPANPVIQQWVKSDPGRIRQVLTNLIGNAIKFTERGEVAVYVSLVEESDEDKTFKFEVKDTGIGVNAIQQKQLFDKFSQADNSTTRKYGGTGLGLSICKKLVELMNGEIGVTSTEGQGSNFWFTLPLEKADIISEPLIYNTEMSNERILIVDDNKTNLELMHQLHNIWDVPHTLIDNAKAALIELSQAIEQGTPYTIAILDMHMPDMDGLQLCQQIQATPLVKETKLVMASSQAQRGDALKMKDAGFKGYITKPIQQSELFDVLLMVSDIKRSAPEFITRHSAKEYMQFKAHVLVVEDNATNQLVIEGVLSTLGITVDIAGNGLEAVTSLQNYSGHDLIFMDCQMPVLDGYQATQKIRSKNSGIINNTIPIVAMTANAMEGDRQKCLDSGMDDYLSKPIDPAKVVSMLEKWLPKKDKDKEVQPDEASSTEVGQIVIDVFDYDDMSQRLMNDPALMLSVADVFWQDFTEEYEDLKESVTLQDITKATAILHKIKGASANVGGSALSALALEMESAGKINDLEAIERNLKPLEEYFANLKKAMKDALL